jgi:hypothetical protein
VLALDDPRWHELDHAYGPADNVPALLLALERGEQELWDELVPSLCHQGSVYTASYAAVPHIVRIGAEESLGDQIMFWCFVGAVADSRDAAPLPDDLRAAYEEALVRAEELTLACIVPGLDEATGLELLIALAGMRRLPAITEALRCLRDETISTTCPRCGSNMRVSTADVPFVVEEDEMVLALGTSGEMTAPRPPHPELHRLARLARSAGLVDLEHRVDALAKGARCPACQLEFSLVGDP